MISKLNHTGLLLKSILLIIFIFPLSANIPVFAEDIVMVSPRPPDSSEGKWFSLVYTEAFKRLGLNLVYKQYPSKRCSFLSNNGVVDGELERVYSFNSAYPNLIRVDTPLNEIRFIALASAPNLSLDSWKSLKNRDFHINYRRGVKLCEEMLLKVVKPENIEAISTAEQGLSKLLAGRTDLYIDIETVIKRAMAKNESARTSLYKAGLLQQITTHPFLHKKHKDLILPLSTVLNSMKQEGLFEIYRKQVEK